MSSLKSFHNLLTLFAADPLELRLFEGVGMESVSILNQRHGGQRWKRAPAATGKSLHHLEAGLDAHGLKLYSTDGNIAAGKDGHIMASNVLRYLHADDYVIVLDRTFATAASLADGTAVFHRANDPNTIDDYHGDRIRAANHDDVLRVAIDVILPLFTSAAS